MNFRPRRIQACATQATHPQIVVLSDVDVVQPDLLLVSNECDRIITSSNIQGAPDLGAEILSPSTADRDRTFKRTLHARHGVKEYWMVDTDKKTYRR